MVNVNDVISAFVKASPESSSIGIARDILEDYPQIGFTLGTLRKKVAEYRDGAIPDKIEVSIDSEEKYWVKQDIYYINHPRGVVKMPVKIIDQIFTDYSKFGYNLSGDEIIAKYDIKPHEWLAVKNALYLYKTSDIISPYTKENSTKEDLENLMDLEISKLFRNKGAITKKYKEVVDREYKRVIERQGVKDVELTMLLTEMYESLEVIKGENYITSHTKISQKGEGFVALADLHFGVSIQNHKLINSYGMNDVENALMEIADRINSYGFKKVKVALMGDLIHSFTGEMHHEMWREMDVQEGIGGPLIVKTAHLLAKFACKIVNFDSFEVIEGNHDRVGEKRSRVSNELTFIICDIIRCLITAPVNYHGKRGVIEWGDINYAISHGDEPLDDKDVYRLLNRLGINNGKFTVVLKAHKHSRMIANADDNHDVMREHVSSIFTQDRYTLGLGYHSRAGFTVFEKDIVTKSGMTLPLKHDHSVSL